jgi:hypothetical protein
MLLGILSGRDRLGGEVRATDELGDVWVAEAGEGEDVGGEVALSGGVAANLFARDERRAPVKMMVKMITT